MTVTCIDTGKVDFAYEELSYDELLLYAKNTLPFHGVLQYNENENYCYLKVHDDFIFRLFPFLCEQDGISIPLYFPPDNICGAHISIVYPEEAASNQIKQDIVNGVLSGVYTFDIEKVVKVTVYDKIFYTVTVVSSDLEYLRSSYNLPVKLDYKNFMVPLHITIAVKILEISNDGLYFLD